MQVRDQILRMLRIQELVLETQAAKAAVDGAPARVDEIEGRFRERNAEYVAIKERFDAIEADRSARAEELTILEDSRKKFMDSLMQVKNQREYAAALKEIDVVKMRIGENEEAVLKAMEESTTLGTDLEARAEHIAAEREAVGRELAEVEAGVNAAKATIARLEGERAKIEAELPPALVQSIRRIEEGRRGVFLAEVDREMCAACHVRVRPQVYQEIRQASKIHACGSCKRFLYHKSVLQPPTPAPPATDPAVDTPPVNAGSEPSSSHPASSAQASSPHPPSPGSGNPPSMEVMNGGTA